jgi:hypothetical protein
MEDRCAGCGYDGRPLAFAEIASHLALVPQRVRAIHNRATDEALRARPEAGGWAAIEYVGHLRDLMAFHRWLIERADAEDEPTIGPADPDVAVAQAGYIDATPNDLLDRLDRRVRRLAAVLEDLDEIRARRRLRLDETDRPIDVGVVARSALHEAHHHLGDLERLVPAPAANASATPRREEH